MRCDWYDYQCALNIIHNQCIYIIRYWGVTSCQCHAHQRVQSQRTFKHFFQVRPYFRHPENWELTLTLDMHCESHFLPIKQCWYRVLIGGYALRRVAPNLTIIVLARYGHSTASSSLSAQCSVLMAGQFLRTQLVGVQLVIATRRMNFSCPVGIVHQQSAQSLKACTMLSTMPCATTWCVLLWTYWFDWLHGMFSNNPCLYAVKSHLKRSKFGLLKRVRYIPRAGLGSMIQRLWSIWSCHYIGNTQHMFARGRLCYRWVYMRAVCNLTASTGLLFTPTWPVNFNMKFILSIAACLLFSTYATANPFTNIFDRDLRPLPARTRAFSLNDIRKLWGRRYY